MNPRTLAGLAAAAALLVPAQADAHPRSNVKSVKAHARSADQALDRVAALVAANDQAAAAVAFARNRVETRRAAAEANRVLRRDASAGASALRAVAAQHDANAEGYAEIVDEATGALQVQVAKGAAASAKGRDRAVAQLTKLAGSLPQAAQGGIARAIAAIQGDTPAEIDALSGALAGGVPADVKPWVELAIGQATAGLNTAITQLQGLIPTLPPVAQQHVQNALDTVSGIVDHVSGILQGVLGGGRPGAAGPPFGR